MGIVQYERSRRRMARDRMAKRSERTDQIFDSLPLPCNTPLKMLMASIMGPRRIERDDQELKSERGFEQHAELGSGFITSSTTRRPTNYLLASPV
jgi:hypothetical protein